MPPAPAPTPAPSPTPTPTPDLSLTDGKTSLLGQALDKAGTPPTPAPSDPPAPASTEPPTPTPAPTGAPDAYAAFKLPEGFALEGKFLEDAGTLFKGMNLSQDQAQSLVDFHTKALAEANAANGKLWQDTQELWIDELRSDPTIGKGIDNGTVGAGIAKMVHSLPAPMASAFREAMNFTGAGNNPAIVRGLYELSKKFAEPGHVGGGGPAFPSKSRPSAAAAMYPTLSEKG